MFNLIKMNLYRLVRTMSFWVMIAVTAVVAVFSVAVTNVDMEYMAEQEPAAVQQPAEDAASGFMVGFTKDEQVNEEDENVAGIYFDTQDEWVEQDIEVVSLIQVMVSSGIVALLAAIFIAIYTNTEQKTGFIKNIAGQLPKRGMLSLAKLIGIATELFIMFSVHILATVISGKVIWGDKLVLGNIEDIVKIIALQYLLHLAFCAFVQMLCTTARGSGIGMTIGIFFCSGFTNFVYLGINYVIEKLGAKDFDISKYDLMTYVKSLTAAADSDMLTKCLIAGAVYLSVCAAVSIIVMQKKDIK